MSVPASMASVHTPRQLCNANPSPLNVSVPRHPAPDSCGSSPPRTPDSYSESCNTPRAHARSTRSRRCTYDISSAPDQDVLATLASSAYSGSPYSTAHAAQSSLASYPSNESKPCSCAAVLQRAYPLHILLNSMLFN